MSDQSKLVLRGRIMQIFPAEIIGQFEKRVMWLEEVDEQYPQTWQLEFHQGSCNEIEGYKAGELVTCSINLRGRHWTKGEREGVMNTLQCWRIVRQGKSTQVTVPPPTPELNLDDPPANDLPF